MGLLDTVVSALGSSNGQTSEQAALLPALIEQVKSFPGGIPGLLEQFRTGGLGAVVASWIGSGPNLPVSGDQLQSVLGSDLLGSLVKSSGLDLSSVLGNLSTMLPDLVDKATPNGEADLEKLESLGSSPVLGALAGMFAKR